MTEEKATLYRGLREVYIDRTTSSYIDGKLGKLYYRGFSIDDLAENCSFEEIIYLVMIGELPTAGELSEFVADLKANMELPEPIIDIIRITKDAHPMDVLRTAISALATFDPEVDDNSTEATLRKGTRLTAQAPTIVASHSRIREGKDPIKPDPDLSMAANFLYMIFGEVPDPEDAKLIDKDFVLHAEHGLNASSFGARVSASTQADLHCAITTGISVLKGPSHGGAAESVMTMSLEIGSEDNAAEYVRKTLDSGGRIMGFGHRVYKAVDPRSLHLQDDLKALGERKGEPKWHLILQKVLEVMQPYSRRGICQNVDFFSGAMYYLLGIPEDLFISIFAVGRIPGWTAQVVEQFENNILLRPRLQYVGELDREFIPIDKRS
ncbi:MAG: citrate (Si)-synthase [Dehalococcoidia bacterium]|nr:citrate (Si)-synthase [Dehalococcoidia bacterium]MCH2312737.1 citrate (Si)-synthase [SAR202 cluster bacterium]MCS5648351.1 citrate (Si)-synthase [Dehalococcoidia bacterium]HAT22720.1 citrate (Si)-synthase [Dehalococcoidia bacterium]|tara:strand:- start:334 stop:1473 length:1140 start_codon:yes stop_codon:yes gene_type:complete